jgi:hypothetical protein
MFFRRVLFIQYTYISTLRIVLIFWGCIFPIRTFTYIYSLLTLPKVVCTHLGALAATKSNSIYCPVSTLKSKRHQVWVETVASHSHLFFMLIEIEIRQNTFLFSTSSENFLAIQNILIIFFIIYYTPSCHLAHPKCNAQLSYYWS